MDPSCLSCSAMGPPSVSVSSPASIAPRCAASQSQPLSLDQILRLYQWEELLVQPFKWTSRHLEVLQCSFDPPSPFTPRRRRHFPPHGDRKAARFACYWASNFGIGVRIRFVRELLAHENSPLRSTTSVAPLFLVYSRILSADMLSELLGTDSTFITASAPSDACRAPVSFCEPKQNHNLSLSRHGLNFGLSTVSATTH